MREIQFESPDTLIPAIIQDASTGKVRMLGYMNKEAYERTLQTKTVHFFSRSKNRIWKKGETSGNELRLRKIFSDCDGDTLLILADPVGPTCHTGAESCFDNENEICPEFSSFILKLEEIIKQRKIQADAEKSYVKKLTESGPGRIAQKVGEESVEFIIESLGNDREKLLEESADLIFHFLVLLSEKNCSWRDVENKLLERHSLRNMGK